MATWRKVLSALTRNGRDATFSTPFSRHAGLEVVQPLVQSLTVAPPVLCAGTPLAVTWNAEDNPPGTVARVLLRPKSGAGAVQTLAIGPLAGSLQVAAPAGRHEVVIELEYELNGRPLHDVGSAEFRGVVPGDTITFELVPACWLFGAVDRWWFDISPGHVGYGPEIVVETLRVSASSGGGWRATRPGQPDLLLPAVPGLVPVPDRPRLQDSAWRFLSEDAGCVGVAPTVTIEFGLGCAA